MAAPSAQARRQGAAGRGAGPQGAAPGGFEPEVPPNYVAPGEGDVLSDEVDWRVDDALTGKTKFTKYSSVEEYRRYLEKALGE